MRDRGRSRPRPRLAGARLALTLLTVLPAGAPPVDRRTARTAVLLAPAVGAVLGSLAGLALAVAAAVGLPALVAATAAVTALAGLTRGLHLDGLADLADGLGSRRPGAGALEVMRRSDVGPFGVATLVLVLLAQVASLAALLERGVPSGALALVVAAATGRTAVVLACRRGVPAARPDGLGALVAGTVPPAAALGVALAVLGAATGLAGGAGGSLLRGSAAVLVGLGAAHVLERHAVRRLGGITGDVLGALVETATTAALLVLATA